MSSQTQVYEKWTYVLLPGSNPEVRFLEHYNAAYKLWHDVWSDTLAGLDGIESLCADDFTRQDRVGALFFEGHCLMLSFFREVDLSLPANRKDSYFKHWSEASLDALMRDSQRVIVASNITLSPQVRGSFHGISMKDLILNLSVEYSKNSGASAQTGSTRNTRGMNKVALRSGGQLLETGVQVHGEETDFYAFYSKDLKHFINEWTPIVRSLWYRRVVAGRSTESGFKKAA